MYTGEPLENNQPHEDPAGGGRDVPPAPLDGFVEDPDSSSTGSELGDVISNALPPDDDPGVNEPLPQIIRPRGSSEGPLAFETPEEEPRADTGDVPGGPPPGERPVPAAEEPEEDPSWQYGADVETLVGDSTEDLIHVNRGAPEAAANEALRALREGDVAEWAEDLSPQPDMTARYYQDSDTPRYAAVVRDFTHSDPGSHDLDIAGPVRNVLATPELQEAVRASGFPGGIVMAEPLAALVTTEGDRVIQTLVTEYPAGHIADGAMDYSGQTPVVPGSELARVGQVAQHLHEHGAVNGVDLDVSTANLRVDGDRLVLTNVGEASTFDLEEPVMQPDEMDHFSVEHGWVQGGDMSNVDLEEAPDQYRVPIGSAVVARGGGSERDSMSLTAVIDGSDVIVLSNPVTREGGVVNASREDTSVSAELAAVPSGYVPSLSMEGTIAYVVGTTADVGPSAGFSHEQFLGVLLRGLGVRIVNFAKAEPGEEVKFDPDTGAVHIYRPNEDTPRFTYTPPQTHRRGF